MTERKISTVASPLFGLYVALGTFPVAVNATVVGSPPAWTYATLHISMVGILMTAVGVLVAGWLIFQHSRTLGGLLIISVLIFSATVFDTLSAWFTGEQWPRLILAGDGVFIFAALAVLVLAVLAALLACIRGKGWRRVLGGTLLVLSLFTFMAGFLTIQFGGGNISRGVSPGGPSSVR